MGAIFGSSAPLREPGIYVDAVSETRTTALNTALQGFVGPRRRSVIWSEPMAYGPKEARA